MEGEGSKRGERGAMKEKASSFAVTCGLLSRYLKEKNGGSPLLDQHQATGGVFWPATTMNLLSGLDVPAEEVNRARTATDRPCPPNFTDLFPHKAGADAHVMLPNSKEGSRGQQLTIFYGGRVVVFDDIPPERVKDLLQMAGVDGAVDGDGGSPAPPATLPRPAQNNASDLPIARRNSLHRFLEKRKERMVAKAPYQAGSSGALAKQAASDGNSWLGLGRPATVKQEI